MANPGKQKANRPLRALAAGLTGASLAALSVWGHAAFLNGETLTRGIDPSVGLPVSHLSLLIDIAFPALALVPLLSLLALLHGPWPIKAASALAFLAGWYWLAEGIASRFALHFGTTWRSGEPFAELFYLSPHTPLLMADSTAAYLLLSNKLSA